MEWIGDIMRIKIILDEKSVILDNAGSCNKVDTTDKEIKWKYNNKTDSKKNHNIYEIERNNNIFALLTTGKVIVYNIPDTKIKDKEWEKVL